MWLNDFISQKSGGKSDIYRETETRTYQISADYSSTVAVLADLNRNPSF